MDLSTTFASLRKKVAGLSLVTLVAGMFATGVATAQTGNIFSDVPADAWFAPYVNGLAEMGVLDTTQDMYRPADLVNRAEMAKLAFMVSGLPLETAMSAPYKDVPMGQWYTNYIYTLTKNGIVSGDKKDGVPTGYFRPSDALNRAEATKMLVNAAQMAEDLSGAPHFPDVKSSDWFYNFVETAFNNGVVAGYPDGFFRPGNNINRAEVAKMVYLSMNPVSAGFQLESAAAAASNKVELIFSMNVEEASAEVAANYSIEDSTGTKLNVTAAEKTAGDTVMLTTASQTSGKVYYVMASNVKSEAGDALSNNDEVSFLGYGADVSGGALSVSLSTQTPVAGSIPNGATGVVFTCWDFKAGSEAAIVKSLRVRRVGPGSETAFDNVYLYRGDSRVTTGRSINNETQTVEFNNINQTVGAGQNVKMCLVADLSTSAAGGVHAFELAAAADVMSNSSSLTGSFPLRGADQLITSATVGSSTLKKNGSLDEVTVGSTGARIAQFEIAAGASEDQELNRIALYVRGSVRSSSLSNLKLFVEGNSTALATAASVGEKDLATFTLAKPYKIGRGQTKIFYVTADIAGARSGETIKIYVDEATDVLITGVTFGYGTRVDINDYDGDEGLTPASSEYSYVLLKGSKFSIAFNGPVASDIALNQQQSRCMDLTITNSAGLDVTIKDWDVTIDAGGLADGLLAAGPTANLTQIKLVRLNEDGSISGTLLGSSELNTAGSDSSQTVSLKGTASIASGESVKAAVVFNVANNAALDGESIRCTLVAPTGNDQVKDSNNDSLGAANITPSSNITGNLHSIVAAALTFTKNSSPANGTKYPKGTNGATLLAFQAKAGSSLDTTIKSLTVKANNVGFDCNGDGDVADTVDETVLVTDCNGDGDTNDTVVNERDYSALNTTDIKDLIDSIGIYNSSGTLVSELKSFPASTTGSNESVITFNNLDIKVAKNATVNLFVKGMVSNSIASAKYIDVYLDGSNLPLIIDQNGQTVTGVSVAAVDGGNANERLELILGSTPTVTPTVTAANDPKIYAEGQSAPIFAFTMKSTDGATTLQDMTVNLSTTAGNILPVDSVALYTSAAAGSCSTATLVKDFETVVASSSTTGSVKFTSINKTLPDSQNVYFCVVLKAKTVMSGQPGSNAPIFLDTDADYTDGADAAIVFDKVQDQSGSTLVVASIIPAMSFEPSFFFQGVPTFSLVEKKDVQKSLAAVGNDVLRWTAGSVGNVDSVEQLVVTFAGEVPTACNLYRGGTLVDSANFTSNEAEFTTGFDWQEGAQYRVSCDYALGALVSGDSSQASLSAINAGGTYDSAIIWDDGNTAVLTDNAFEDVDAVIFRDTDNLTGPKFVYQA